MLRYNIMSEMLYGTVAGQSISMKAYSGGGRGSKSGVERSNIRHWDTQKKAPAKYDEANRGGPLPQGYYIVKYLGKYKHYGVSARLEQTLTSLLYSDFTSDISPISVTQRDGFLIHGMGPKGSDGCIVPANAKSLNHLLSALKKSKAPVWLAVHSSGIMSDKLKNVGDIA